VELIYDAHILDILAHDLRCILGDIDTGFCVVVGFYMWTHVDLGSLCGPSLMVMMYQ
jgi:hypothetical protein